MPNHTTFTYHAMNATERATLINLRRFVSFLVLIAQVITSNEAIAFYKKAGVAAYNACRAAYQAGYALRGLVNRLENTGTAPHQILADSAQKAGAIALPFIGDKIATLHQEYSAKKAAIFTFVNRFTTEVRLINQW